MIASTTSAPPSVPAPNTARARASRRSALLERIRSSTRPPRDRRDPRRERLGHRVDRVRAHRVADVDQQVQHDVRAAGTIDHAHLDVLRPAAEPDQNGVLLVGQLEQLVAVLEQAQLGRVRVGDVDDLDLGDHHRLVGRAEEAAVLTGDLREVARRRHDRGLLGGHRHEVVLAVDAEVGADAQRQWHHADDVLHHAVGQPEQVRVIGAQRGDRLRLDVAGVEDLVEAFLRSELVEAGQAAVDGHGFRSSERRRTAAPRAHRRW